MAINIQINGCCLLSLHQLLIINPYEAIILIVKMTDIPIRRSRKKIGDFEDWIIEKCSFSRTNYLVVNVKNRDQLPQPSSLAGVIITGSHDNITEQTPWMLQLCDWLKQLPQEQVPVLGICFGHQVLAHALGGKVGYHPNGGEYGLVPVKINKTKLPQPFFTQLPDEFFVFASHEQTVLRQLPAGAKITLAKHQHEHQTIGTVYPQIWGCQFHPEFSHLVSDHYASGAGLKIENQPRKYGEAEEIGKQILHDFARLCFQKK
jgi:GMP synthase (glutamine-hydrolysing)